MNMNDFKKNDEDFAEYKFIEKNNKQNQQPVNTNPNAIFYLVLFLIFIVVCEIIKACY